MLAASIAALAAAPRRALPLLAALVAPLSVAAQSDVATEGALFVLLPVGGRAVGLGQAVVATVDGSEAVWWNPAGLARQEKREVAIHHSNPFLDTSADAVSLVVPSSLLGVLALSVNMLDYGTEEQRDANNQFKGYITTRNFLFAASYATAVGSRLNAGVTYKVLQFRVSCTAGCPLGIGANATSSAVDVGGQYELRGLAPVALGVAIRNLGPSLQVNDNAQSDALPARLQVGARWRVRAALDTAQTEVGVAADVVTRLQGGMATYRVGADATWRKRASLRAGFLLDPAASSGASVGFGLRQGRLLVEVARDMSGNTEATGGEPTYLSLRYLF